MGAVIAAITVGKTSIPPIYFLFLGGILAIAGTAGLSVIPKTPGIWAPQYVFQILAGAGAGCFNGMLTLLTPFAFEKRDLGEFSLMSILYIVDSQRNGNRCHFTV
jgi:hypothetical protein